MFRWLKVTDESGAIVRVQLIPVFISPSEISGSEFEIAFIVTVPPLGMATYFIRQFDGPINTNT